MSVNDRQDIVQQATVPDNLDQGPRFGTVTELVKDVFVLELRHFFNTAYTQVRNGELPRIDKYSVAVDVTTDPLETAVSLIRSYPDITEDMPLIAVLATTGRNMRLSISDHLTSIVVPNAKVISNVHGPYALTDGMTLIVESQPDGVVSSIRQSTFKFPAFMFQNIAAATVDEIVSVINFQALYVTAYKENVGGEIRLAIKAGGPNGTQFPNKITIKTGGTATAILGFAVDQTDQNYGVGKKAMFRHHTCSDVTMAIEVVAESENIRTELTDLLVSFLTYVLADRKYTFYGRSTYDSTIQDETYQIIIRDNEISLSGESEIPRQGDMRDKIYVNRITVPVTALQFSDRTATNANGSITTPLVQLLIQPNDSLPEPN